MPGSVARARAAATAVILVMTAVALALAPHRLRAQQPAAADSAARRPAALPTPEALGAEELLVELRLARRFQRSATAWRRGEEALLPMPEFCALVELQCVVRDGSLRAPLPPDGRQLVIPLAGGTASLGTRSAPVLAGQIARSQDTVFVAAGLLSHLFALEIQVAWADLVVDVPDLAPFPIGLRLAREAARQLLAPATIHAPADTVLALRRPYLHGAVLDYTVQLQSGTAQPPTSSLLLQGGVDVLGGSLIAAVPVGRAPGDAGSARWLGVWRENRWLRTMQVGDGSFGGPHPRLVRGLVLSNSPYLRPLWLGRSRYTGLGTPGAVVEAYAGGQLIAYDSSDADGRWSLALPLAYGENLVEFVTYEPTGVAHRASRTSRVLSDVIPRRTWEYALAGGRCRLGATCRATGAADLRWAPANQLTLRAGVDLFTRDSLPALVHPYVGVVGTMGRMLSGSVLAVHDAPSRLFLAFEPTFDQRLFLTYSRAPSGVARPVLGVTGERDQLGLSLLLRPAAHRDRFFLELNAARVRSLSATTTTYRGALSVQGYGARLVPYLRTNAVSSGTVSDRRTGAGFDLFLQPPARFGAPLRSLFVRASLERLDFATGGVRSNLSLARHFFGWIRMETSVQTTGLGGPPTFLLLFNADRNQLRTVGAATTLRDRWAYQQTITGTLIGDPGAQFTSAQRGPGIDRAGLHGTLFVDDDGDGLRDPGEAGIPDVIVRAGSARAATDADGRYRLWDLVPWEPVRVDVDPETLPTPLLRPRHATAEVTPGPNGFVRHDMAYVQAGTVDGRVEREYPGGRRVPLAGAGVLFEPVRGGAALRVTTFGDGEFSALGVTPGEYTVRVERAYLERIGLADTPVRVTVRAIPDGDQVTGVSLVLRPFAAAAAPTPVVIAPVDGDDDADGVRNSVDRCARTPRGSKVDATGCPVTQPAMRRLIVLRGVTFETGKAVLTTTSFAVLDSVAADLRARPDVRVEVGGHTDITGTVATNTRLSQARADTVRAYLVRAGVPEDRLTARGYGSSRPAATNATAAGRAQNRRVELLRLDEAAAEAERAGGGFSLRAGTYTTELAAVRVRDGYLRRDIDARVVELRVGTRTRWAVHVGRFETQAEARGAARRLLGAAAAARAQVIANEP